MIKSKSLGHQILSLKRSRLSHLSSFLIGVFILIGLVVIFVRNNLLLVIVDNHSMLPALRHGDRILMLRNYPSKWLHKGQIVVVKQPFLPFNKLESLNVERLLIKRIVGLPGDTFFASISDLSKNLQPFEAKLYDERGKRSWFIPTKSFFVCGDNRRKSMDSRSLGPFPFSSLVGVFIVKLPTNH